MVTRETVRRQLEAYLNREKSLKELVDWAENAVAEEEFDLEDVDLLMEVVGRIGLADVENFTLSWEDISQMLSNLHYRANVQVMAV